MDRFLSATSPGLVPNAEIFSSLVDENAVSVRESPDASVGCDSILGSRKGIELGDIDIAIDNRGTDFGRGQEADFANMGAQFQSQCEVTFLDNLEKDLDGLFGYEVASGEKIAGEKFRGVLSPRPQ